MRPDVGMVSAIGSARASVVGLESAIAAGSGYVALSNGVIVTSQRVVGYERDVLIIIDDGSAIPASVIRVNVALDIALVVPNEQRPLPPVVLRDEPPKLGESITLLGRLGNEPIAVSTRISMIDRMVDGLSHFQVPIPFDKALLGGAVIDEQGRLVGSLVRSRGDTQSDVWLENLILPLAAFEGGLMSVEGPTNDLLSLMPEYGCPYCDTIFEPSLDRCLECGISLPHPWAETAVPTAELPAGAAGRLAFHAVRIGLKSLGIPSNRARVGPALWRFGTGAGARDCQVEVTVDQTGHSLVLSAEAARIPNGLYEPYYRHLLAMNGEFVGTMRLGVRGSAVILSVFEPAASVNAASFPRRVSELVSQLTRVQDALARSFGSDQHSG